MCRPVGEEAHTATNLAIDSPLGCSSTAVASAVTARLLKFALATARAIARWSGRAMPAFAEKVSWSVSAATMSSHLVSDQ